MNLATSVLGFFSSDTGDENKNDHHDFIKWETIKKLFSRILKRKRKMEGVFLDLNLQNAFLGFSNNFSYS